MILRSKSAPKPLSDLATFTAGPPSRSRPRLLRSRTALTISAATPLTSPREAREDPFSLVGFFPSCPADSQDDWDWIRSSEAGAHGPEDEEEDEDGSMYDSFSPLSMPGQPKSKNEESSYDEFARQVIDGEDKLGMLAFSSENLPSLLRSKMPVFERPTSPVHVSPLAVDEPLDLDALYTKHCSRRETSTPMEAERGPKIGQLFFSAEEEKKDDGGWSKLLYARLVGLVGSS